MITMIMMYTITGITWGVVLYLIGVQEDGWADNLVKQYPGPLHKTVRIVVLVITVALEAVAWPIDVPVMLVKIARHKYD